MKVHVLTLAAALVATSALAGSGVAGAGGSRALVGSDGAVIASVDGGDRWSLVHLCPAIAGTVSAAGGWEIVAADDAIAGAGACPERPLLSWDGPVLRLTCDGGELYEWRPGQPGAIPIGQAACLPAAPTLDRRSPPPSRPVLVPRRARLRRWVPRLDLGLERRRAAGAVRGHTRGDGHRTDTILWFRLTWRLDG